MTFTQGAAILCLIAFLIYFLPTIIGFLRGHPNRWVIFLINLVLGATVLAWIGCLIWALNAIHKPVGSGSAGGESGLNVFVNDEKQVRIVNDSRIAPVTPYVVETPSPDIAERLEKLAKMHSDGILTADEFQTLKTKLIYS